MTVDDAVKALVTAHRAEEASRSAVWARRRAVEDCRTALSDATARLEEASALLGQRVQQRSQAEQTLLRAVAEEGQDGETPAGMASLNP